MLPEVNRLTGADNFKKIEQEGKIFQSHNMGLAYMMRGDKSPSRFGFIVSTKISKDAVDRNRIKRILREAVRQILFKLNPGFDVVFLAKPSVIRIPTDAIMKEAQKSLEKIGITK